jgi:hypothetical protein
MGGRLLYRDVLSPLASVLPKVIAANGNWTTRRGEIRYRSMGWGAVPTPTPYWILVR